MTSGVTWPREILSPLAHHRLVRSANDAVYGVLSRLPLFLSWPSRHHNKTPEIKIKQTTNTDIHNNQMLSSWHVLHVCMCEKTSRVLASHTDTLYGAADKHTHTHTHVSVHRPRPSLPNPPILQYTASVLLQFRLSYCLGVGVLFVVWVRGTWERDRWRGGVRRSRRCSMVLSWSAPLCRWPAPACSSVSVSLPARLAPKLTRSGGKRG